MSINPSAAERRFLDARGGAARVGISVPSFWRGVALKRLPAPSYPTPGAPRWNIEELDRAMEAAKALPRDNLAARRAQRLAARQAAAAVGSAA